MTNPIEQIGDDENFGSISPRFPTPDPSKTGIDRSRILEIYAQSVTILILEVRAAPTRTVKAITTKLIGNNMYLELYMGLLRLSCESDRSRDVVTWGGLGRCCPCWLQIYQIVLGRVYVYSQTCELSPCHLSHPLKFPSK
jgi:hypothetical protein